MKKMFFLSLAVIYLLTACENQSSGAADKPDDPVDPNVSGQKTVIVFDNTNGTCAAVIYNNHLRTEDTIVAEVRAGQLSKEIEWMPGSIPFYFSYDINLVGINFLSVKYIPEFGRDQVNTRVDANKKTVITIPPLAQAVSSPETLLSKNSYLIIQNNSSFSIHLQRGASVGMIIKPDNLPDTGVNSGERAHYTLLNSDNRSVSVYQLNENARYSTFPASLIDFEPGRVYSFVYNGSSISLFSVLDIKLANVAAGSLDDPGNKTYVRFINNNDFSVSVYTNFARNNKIADAPALSQSSAVQTDPNLSGAVFYPNYNIVIEGVTIPYQGDLIVTRIDAGRAAELPNTVTIPLLEHLDDVEFEKPLSNSAYIKIQNDASLSLSFRSGTSDLIPHGTMSSIVNGGETALYIVNAGSASNYSFRRNTVTPISFPSNVTQFESGRLYSFRFDGTALVLLTEKPLTLKQAFSLSPPENIAARTRPSGSIVLSWNKVGIESSYKIYRAEENPDNFVYISSTVNTTYTDDNVLLGNTYYYKLVSVKNTMESGMSENYVSVLSEISSLSAPAGLTATVQGHDRIMLSWNSAEDASTYMIYRGYSSSSVNTYVTATSSTSYLVSALEEYTGYWFTVSAANSNSESYPSEAVYGQTFSNVPPEPPTGLNASTTNNSIQISWNNVTGVTSYKVYRSTSENGTYSLAGNISSSPFTDNGLTSNTTYYYKVSSVRGLLEGALSGSVSIKFIQTVTPPGSTLAQQLAYIRNHTGNGTVFEIVVNNDEYMSPASITSMGINIMVNIRSASPENVRTIQLEGQGHLFSIDTGVTVTLQDIVLRGHSNNNKALVGVGNGKLILNSGSKVTGNSNIANGSDLCGGGIRVNGGTLELNDNTEISNNTIPGYGKGGGIYVGNQGIVNIKNGFISENIYNGQHGANGGGIYIAGNSTVTMSGGVIQKNTASIYGAGVFIEDSGSTFTKRAASGNSSSGIIYGFTGDNANIAKGDPNNPTRGHAIYRDFSSRKMRNTTLGPGDEISSGNDVGWE